MLNIHCDVGSELRVAGCELLRADHCEEQRHHYHHHHLDTCPQYQTEPKTILDDEIQKAVTVGSVMKQVIDRPTQYKQHHHHHRRRRHHLCDDDDDSPQQEPCADSSTDDKTMDSCVKTSTVSDCCCLDRDFDSQTYGHSYPDVGSVTSSESLIEPRSRTCHLEKVPPLCSVLNTACDEQMNSQHCHPYQDHNVHETETRQDFTSRSDMKDDWFYLDRAVIGQLNDVFWVESCLGALQQLINHHHHQQQRQLIISSQTPSMFPIAALRLGLVSSVCLLDLDPVHRPLIGRLLSANGIGESHVTYGRPRQRDVTSVLFADIVSSDGCLRQNVFELLTEARSVSSAIYHVFVICKIYVFWLLSKYKSEYRLVFIRFSLSLLMSVADLCKLMLHCRQYFVAFYFRVIDCPNFEGIF